MIGPGTWSTAAPNQNVNFRMADFVGLAVAVVGSAAVPPGVRVLVGVGAAAACPGRSKRPFPWPRRDVARETR